MATSETPSNSKGSLAQRLLRPAQVLIVSSIAFTFISYWRTAAVVLCDMASTSFYIGGIVEQFVGPAAPWFILAVLLLSGLVILVYIESSSLFVRGGVYRVVREALGRFLAKIAVSALMFDFILTGPISGVAAGQYIIGLLLETYQRGFEATLTEHTRAVWKSAGSVVIASLITLYFFRKNIIGIHESSDKALKIILVTTVMGVLILGWCGVTLLLEGPRNDVPIEPVLTPRPDPVTGGEEDPLGWLAPLLADHLPGRGVGQWLSVVGIIGILISFGHSILAMSGLETLAQVYREVESPKLPNFKKAALIVFTFSLCLTGSISFLAVLLIPDDVRMALYKDNLIGGLAMNVLGPVWAKLLLNAFVVVVGFLILAGAVNTAMIGSNGVLNRVAEDGVMPDWFLKPHPRYGTTHRILFLIVGLQLFTIVASRGDVLLLGEAYAFGVVWSFVFQALSMTVLRFKDRRPREFKVPVNVRLGSLEIPIGLGLILVILLIAALLNLLTKEKATIGGLIFTCTFFTVFLLSERYHERKRRGAAHEHLEQFNQQTAEEITPDGLGLTKQYRKLVAIRSPQNLFMLEKALAETDPETTDVVVMTAKVAPVGGGNFERPDLDAYDQHLMTAVVDRAERAGKQVKPLIVPTNNPFYAVIRTAKELSVNELIMGASNKFTADEQMEQIAFYWITALHGGQPAPLTVRILSRDRDVYLDLAGGNRIPKISERKARSVAELRAAGIGVDKVILLHDGSPAASDLFQAVLTMLDPQVSLTLIPTFAEPTSAPVIAANVHVPPLAEKPPGEGPGNGQEVLQHDLERAEQLGRDLQLRRLDGDFAARLVELAREDQHDLIIIGLSTETPTELNELTRYVLGHAHCRVFLAASPTIPQEVVDTTQAAAPA